MGSFEMSDITCHQPELVGILTIEVAKIFLNTLRNVLNGKQGDLECLSFMLLPFSVLDRPGFDMQTNVMS